MIAIAYRFLISDVDRHGNKRFYVRRKGAPKVRIRATPGTAEFDAEYRVALGAVAQATPAHTAPREGTWRWLVSQYLRSAEFKALHASTQRVRLRLLQDTWREPRAPGAAECFADMPVARITERAVVVLRDRKAGVPEAANSRLKAIRRVFSWAKEARIVARDPARDVRFIRTGSQGHHSWTPEEVEQFKQHHRLGTKAYLALMVILLTGVRRSDVVRLGRPHEKRLEDGTKTLAFTVTKNQHRKPMRIEIPILPQLQAVIEASQTGDMTYLVTEYGRPFTLAGFGNWFRDRCNEAGLSHCSAHGLRKAAAATAAENGATTQQLMAMFVWSTSKEADRYTRAAERKKMAADGMALMVRR